MKVTYLAVVHRGESGSFGLHVPDVPGFVTAGDTLEELMKNASEGLAFHLEGMLEDGIAPPDPLPQVSADEIDPEEFFDVVEVSAEVTVAEMTRFSPNAPDRQR